MNKRTMLAVAVAAALLAAGCEKTAEKPKEEAAAAPAAPAVDVAAEEAAIRNKSAEWMNFANAHDAASIAKNFAPDAITIYDGRVRRGAAEVQAGIEQDARDNPNAVVAWSTTAVKVAASGDLAYETGNITLDPDGAAGKKPSQNGTYVTVWEKADGTWRVVADAGTDNEKKDAAAH
jgi:uncharacterized protein (TIGR02246 family)